MAVYDFKTKLDVKPPENGVKKHRNIAFNLILTLDVATS
jgi:hypothetical protein